MYRISLTDLGNTLWRNSQILSEVRAWYNRLDGSNRPLFLSHFSAHLPVMKKEFRICAQIVLSETVDANFPIGKLDRKTFKMHFVHIEHTPLTQRKPSLPWRFRISESEKRKWRNQSKSLEGSFSPNQIGNQPTWCPFFVRYNILEHSVHHKISITWINAGFVLWWVIRALIRIRLFNWIESTFMSHKLWVISYDGQS